jgi:transposase
LRKVELNLKENHHYQVIKKLVETNGNKQRAAWKLNCSRRHINRLIQRYQSLGKKGFIHGNKGRVPSNKIDDQTRSQILEIYTQVFPDANLRHATELLKEHYDIHISDTTLNTILRQHFILSPKAWRQTKKTMTKTLKDLKVQTNTPAALLDLDLKLDELDRHDAHPRRPRCAYMGELIQMDASEHVWFGSTKTHLHLAIDDATGKIVGAYFDDQETLQGYYQVLYQILTNYGIPYQFLTDRRTVFEYKLKNAPSDREDTFTQFSYACHQLGIEINTTSVPQAKGRVERLNETLQSRWIVELRLQGITTLEQANQFLPQLILKFNQQFALDLHHSKNVFEIQPSQPDINFTLAVLDHRKIDTGHCIKYKKKFYLPLSENGTERYFVKGTQALVIKAFDGQLYVNVNDKIYRLKEVLDRHERSYQFDSISDTQPPIQKIPKMHHPWRIGYFQAYIHQQKHRQNGAHV